jgi:hypothetical protein
MKCSRKQKPSENLNLIIERQPNPNVLSLYCLHCDRRDVLGLPLPIEAVTKWILAIEKKHAHGGKKTTRRVCRTVHLGLKAVLSQKLMTATVRDCEWCAGTHINLKFRILPRNKPFSLHTHWARCPVTKAPLFTRLEIE